MAKTKRKKTKKRLSFRPGSLKKEKKKTSGWFGSSLVKLLKVSSVICVVLAIAVLIYIADKKYIKSEDSVQTGPVVLMDTPEWVGDQLKAEILSNIGADTVKLDEDAAVFVYEKLSTSPWLADVNAITTDDSMQVIAKYRKPVAVVDSGITPFYVDIDRYVMDYVPMPHLLIVEIKGLSLATQVPRIGEIWEREDLDAAIEIIEQLILMDIIDSPDRPLLREIASIDVSNFGGLQNDGEPHIVLYSQDNTPIIWGAELGAWQTYLESTDEQKLAKLYGYYKEKGTLNGGTQVKYINLCDPRDNIPLPIDKY